MPRTDAPPALDPELSEQRYRSLFDNIDEGFCVVEMLFGQGGEPADYRFLEVNPAFVRQTGLVDAVGKRMRELAPDHEQHWFDIYGEIARTGEPKRFQHRADALGHWYDVYAFRIDRPEQCRVAILFHDIGERKRQEEALRKSEEQLDLIFATLPIGLAAFDCNGRIFLSNDAIRRFLPRGRIPSTDGALSRRWKGFGPDGAPLDPRDFPGQRALRGEAVVPGQEMLHRLEDGSEIWTRVAAVPIHDAARTIVGAYAVVVDIDAIKRSEERLRDSESRLRLLLAELQHRVRNILAMIRSLARQSLRPEQAAEDYLAHLLGRIDAMARTQVLLTRAPDAAIDLEDLVRNELVAQAGPPDLATVSGPPVALSARAGEILTLALHELATNSVKYGTLGAGHGILAIEWNTMMRDGEQWLELRWRERGGLSVAGRAHDGFGTEVIERRVPYELGGSASLDIGDGRLNARIAFPLRGGTSVLETGALAGPRP